MLGQDRVHNVVAGLIGHPEHINYGEQLINIIEVTEMKE